MRSRATQRRNVWKAEKNKTDRGNDLLSERENWDNGLDSNHGHRSEVILAFCAKYKVPTRPLTQEAMYEYLSQGKSPPSEFNKLLANCAFCVF